jgi:hypothetical protein
MAGNNQYAKQYSNLAKTPQKGSAEYGKVEKDSQQEYLDRLKAIDMRIKQTQALREGDMASIRRNTAQAQNDINDQMFREYLANKERMGGRGLSGSGLMADAQIRLNANKQDRLGELYTQQQDKLSDVHRTYAPQQTELLGERQGTRQSKIFQEMFDKMMENRQRELQAVQPLMQNEFTKSERLGSESFQAKQEDLKAKRDMERLQKEINARAAEAEKQRQADMVRLEKELAARANSDAMANARAEADLAFKRGEAELDRQNALPRQKYEHYMTLREAHRQTKETILTQLQTAVSSGNASQSSISNLEFKYAQALRAEQLATEYASRYMPK